MKSQAPKILLASSSPYRKALLKRLEIPFNQANPDTDESRLADESPANMAERLSIAKAKNLGKAYTNHYIIGSDQTIALGSKIFGKPGDHETAVSQLLAFSGKTIDIFTGLSLYDPSLQRQQSAVVKYQATFKGLSAKTIESYLLRERPYDCAGSLKSEGLGTALLASLEGPDPTAIIGLPLIKLCTFFENWGVKIL